MTLSGRQLLVLKIGIALMAANIIVPPWTYTLNAGSVYSEKPAGYHFIFEPPAPARSGLMHGVKVDISRLFIQVFAIFLVAAFGMIEVKPSIKKTREPKVKMQNTKKEKPMVKTGDPWTD